MVASDEKSRQRRRAARAQQSSMDISEGEDHNRNTSSEDEGDGGNHQSAFSQTTKLPTTIGPVNPDAEALISTATQMAGSADGGSLALAALRANDPKDAFILLAASSTKAAMEVQRSNKTAASAMVKAQLAEESNTNSDYTFEIRWKQQLKENERLNERLDRVEAVIKQLVAMVVQTRGADDDQVAEMMKNLGL